MLDGITRWTRVATSGVVLFGIALVFTFNALVSMMQFIASEDTLQGWCSGPWAARARLVGQAGHPVRRIRRAAAAVDDELVETDRAASG